MREILLCIDINAKVKGFQVAPAELEGCILDHTDVANACVVGIPDDYSKSYFNVSPTFPLIFVS